MIPHEKKKNYLDNGQLMKMSSLLGTNGLNRTQ